MPKRREPAETATPRAATRRSTAAVERALETILDRLRPKDRQETEGRASGSARNPSRPAQPRPAARRPRPPGSPVRIRKAD